MLPPHSRALDPPLGAVRAARRLLPMGALAAALAGSYGASWALGAPAAMLAALFVMPLLVIVPVGWLAVARAPADQRAVWSLLAASATVAVVGGGVWLRAFAAEGVSLVAPGPWDGFFFAAYSLALVGVLVAVRGVISIRHATLDAWVMVSAGVAVGTAVAGRGLERGVAIESAASVTRPVLGVLMLTLIVTAALEARDGVPLSIVLVGVGQICFTAGNFLYSYGAVQARYDDAAWAYAAWVPGFAFSLLGAAVVALRVDRPVQLFAPAPIPSHPVGAKTVLYASLAALAVSLGVAWSGYVAGSATAVAGGLAAGLSIGVAMALRASNAIHEVEIAYARLDSVLAAEEEAQNELARANTELARTNVQLTAVHAAFEELLALVDERSGGALRDLIEESGDDLARMLDDYLARAD